MKKKIKFKNHICMNENMVESNIFFHKNANKSINNNFTRKIIPGNIHQKVKIHTGSKLQAAILINKKF